MLLSIDASRILRTAACVMIIVSWAYAVRLLWKSGKTKSAAVLGVVMVLFLALPYLIIVVMMLWGR